MVGDLEYSHRQACLPRQGKSHPDTGRSLQSCIFIVRLPEHPLIQDSLTRVKTYWAEMEATAIATRGPTGGQDSPKHYFEEVQEGTRLIEAQCSKSTMFG